MNKTRNVFLLIIGLIVIAGIAVLFYKNYPSPTVEKKEIVINEAIHTLLYLPLYHAEEGGFFKKHGLTVKIVTGGTATNSTAAMMSGEADFSQADPMYVPIANQNNAQTKVVAQVVSKIAVWGLTKDLNVNEISVNTIKGKTISTQVAPMTAYTYAVKAVKDLGLDPEKDVKILQNKPGTEITPMLLGQADYSFTLEPAASTAISQGAKIVMSYPQLTGEQIFTGLMAKEDFIKNNKQTVISVLKAYQESINELYSDREKAYTTAKKYFPQLEEKVLKMAVDRLFDEGVISKSILVSNESWDKAIKVRVEAGDLKQYSSRDQNLALDLINEVINSK
jgi:NitT/TauT family transport system substrate-binding protein